MKQIIKSLNQRMSTVIIALMVLVCLAALVFACSEKDKSDESLEMSQLIEVYSGYHKIKLRWEITDPNISSTIIYWSKRSNSKTVSITQTGWQEIQLDDMAEDVYYFEFVMQYKSGNFSKPIEVPGAVYGDSYIESLPIRGASLNKLPNGEVEINWTAVSSATLQKSVVEYLDDNRPATKEASNSESKTMLPSSSSGVSIYAVHFPLKGFEAINSLKKRLFMPKNPRLLDKSLYSAFFMPGDNTTPEPGNSDDAWKNPLPSNIDTRDIRALWDGNIRNDARPGGPAMRGILHTADQSNDWANARFKYPHCFTFSIGTLAYLTNLKIHGRADAGAFTGHSPRYFEVWVTDNPKMRQDFGSDVAFEQYYRTTYVNHRAVDNQTQTNPNGNSAYTGQEFIATPPAGINNWQQDWIKIGDFENKKPSGQNYNTANDADRAVWGNNSADLDIMTCGFDHQLTDVDTKVKYVRLVIKYPNWQHTNCINMGEVTFWGDDL